MVSGKLVLSTGDQNTRAQIADSTTRHRDSENAGGRISKRRVRKIRCQSLILNEVQIFGLISGLLVLAFAANRLFRITRIPDLVVLLVTGLVLGPVLKWVDADALKTFTHILGSLALILILFE